MLIFAHTPTQTRSIWHWPGTFWQVTRVRLKEGDPNHGKAWYVVKAAVDRSIVRAPSMNACPNHPTVNQPTLPFHLYFYI